MKNMKMHEGENNNFFVFFMTFMVKILSIYYPDVFSN